MQEPAESRLCVGSSRAHEITLPNGDPIDPGKPAMKPTNPIEDAGQNTSGDILIVDDLPNNLDLLRSILARSGYRVRTANSGRLALRVVSTHPPDLILLDINMPEMDGYEVCRILKTDPALAAIPIIFISALDEVKDKIRGFEVGGVDYVVKPFQAEEVLARVENQLEIHRLRRKLERRNRVLERMNRELSQSQEKVKMVFSALSEVLPGSVLDHKYALDRRIGSGGHGTVYEGKHVGLDKKVAIKILQPSSRNVTPESLERFQLEGISACRIHHPNAVQVLDCGVSNRGIAYLVMELLSGLTLRELLDQEGRLTVRRAAEIAIPVASVLAQASSNGLVHRDIKPANILLHRDIGSGREVVKVVDFGIAKMLDHREENEEVSTDAGPGNGEEGLIGTPHYIAPERLLEGEDSIASDIYSLGVTLYEALGGCRPYGPDGNGLRMLVKICQQKPRPLGEVAPDLPAAVVDFIMSMVSHDPEERPTPEEVERFFEPLQLSAETEPARRPTALSTQNPKSIRLDTDLQSLNECSATVEDFHTLPSAWERGLQILGRTVSRSHKAL